MADAYGPTLTALTQFGTFTAFMPSLREVRNASPSDATIVGDIRFGEVVAGGIALTIGAVAASMSGTALPLFTAILVIAGMVALYEYTLYNKPFASTATREAADNG